MSDMINVNRCKHCKKLRNEHYRAWPTTGKHEVVAPLHCSMFGDRNIDPTFYEQMNGMELSEWLEESEWIEENNK